MSKKLKKNFGSVGKGLKEGSDKERRRPFCRKRNAEHQGQLNHAGNVEGEGKGSNHNGHQVV